MAHFAPEYSLGQTEIKKAKKFSGFEIDGVLDSKLKKDKEPDRRHVVMLLNIPKEQTAIKSIDADFHLKSNFTFDAGMKVGNVQLVRAME